MLRTVTIDSVAALLYEGVKHVRLHVSYALVACSGVRKVRRAHHAIIVGSGSIAISDDMAQHGKLSVAVARGFDVRARKRAIAHGNAVSVYHRVAWDNRSK